MNKKGLFTAILSLVLVLAGCNSNNPGGTTETPADPNKVERVKGNGESYPEAVQTLIDKAIVNDKDPESVPVKFINAEYYSAEYYEADETTGSQISKITSITCENSTSFSATESNEIMTSYTAALEEAGFEIDKSDFAKYGVYSATRKIKLNEYFVIEYGLKELSYDETTYESFNAFVLYYAYIKSLATNGWSGVDITEWPTEDITELTGTDIPHPDLNYNTISLFGGFNTLVITDEDTGKNSYLDCYVLLLTGSVKTDEDAYIQQLEDAYWQVATYEGEGNGGYGFNMLSQVVVEFFYMTQTGYEGLCLFIYVNNPSYVFTKSEAWPEIASYLPAYTQEGATLSYYYVSVRQSLFQTMELIAVGGVAENADELYATQLTAAGWSVETETDTDGLEYYYAINNSYGECIFYMGTYPDAGITLFIQSSAY